MILYFIWVLTKLVNNSSFKLKSNVTRLQNGWRVEENLTNYSFLQKNQFTPLPSKNYFSQNLKCSLENGVRDEGSCGHIWEDSVTISLFVQRDGLTNRNYEQARPYLRTSVEYMHKHTCEYMTLRCVFLPSFKRTILSDWLDHIWI